MYVLKVSDKFSIVYSDPEMRGGEIIVTLQERFDMYVHAKFH